MIHSITPSLYETVCGWWKKCVSADISQEILSPHGYVSLVNDKPVMAGWLYKAEGCGFSMLGFPIMNPEANSEDRRAAFKEFMEHVEGEAKSLGAKILLINGNNDHFMNRFLERGFKETDKNITFLIKGV